MDPNRGLIFDIQPFSVHDGPGCRTNVFFAGCPLRCKWCANPENFAGRQHLMFSDRTCKWGSGCRACTKICPYGGLSFDESGPKVNWDVCNKCKTIECASICASEALKVCGKYYTVDELMRILKRDFNDWGSEGGVTFTGGEPLLHYEFLLKVLKECAKVQIHTAIETSAHVANDKFLNIFKYLHFAFIDVKNMDDEKHIAGTGVSNKLTLDNIASLKPAGWKGRLVLRIPTIAGYNDSTENALKVIEFMHKHDLYEINLLPFHRMGQTKWEQLGMRYAYETGGEMSEERLQELQTLYLDNNIACYLAHQTSF